MEYRPPVADQLHNSRGASPYLLAIQTSTAGPTPAPPPAQIPPGAPWGGRLWDPAIRQHAAGVEESEGVAAGLAQGGVEALEVYPGTGREGKACAWHQAIVHQQLLVLGVLAKHLRLNYYK